MDVTQYPDLGPSYPFRPQAETTPRDAAAALRTDPDYFILDVREADELRVARIDHPRVVHIPLSQVEARRDELDAGAQTPFAVLCHHGRRSLRATLALQALGLHGARSIAGGIDLWTTQVDAGVPRY
jgi:rhodanese-related sulfurtransferase